MSENFNCDENLEIEIVNFESQEPRKLKHKWITGVSDNNKDFMFELVKAELDKCLIETIKECLYILIDLLITKQIIKLTEQELEEVFDKVNMSEENRMVYRNVYFNEK